MQHITQARQQIAEARQLLQNRAGQDGRLYQKRKYVRQAGKLTWEGVLTALRGTLALYDLVSCDHNPDLTDYRQFIQHQDSGQLTLFLTAIDTIVRAVSGDGNLSVVIVSEALLQADELIDWCERISIQANTNLVDVDVSTSGSETRLSILEIASTFPKRSIEGLLEPHEMMSPEERIAAVRNETSGR